MRELKEGGRVEVDIKPICIFLFKDGGSFSLLCLGQFTYPNRPTGTVISVHPDNDLKFTEPIRRRLTQRDTGLRSTADASLLVHGLLDLGSLMWQSRSLCELTASRTHLQLSTPCWRL